MGDSGLSGLVDWEQSWKRRIAELEAENRKLKQRGDHWVQCCKEQEEDEEELKRQLAAAEKVVEAARKMAEARSSQDGRWDKSAIFHTTGAVISALSTYDRIRRGDSTQ